MAKAQHEGIAFDSIFKFATKAFVDGDLSLGLVGIEKFNATTSRDVVNAQKDISQGKNLSPNFRSAKEAINFLKK